MELFLCYITIKCIQSIVIQITSTDIYNWFDFYHFSYGIKHDST